MIKKKLMNYKKKKNLICACVCEIMIKNIQNIVRTKCQF